MLLQQLLRLTLSDIAENRAPIEEIPRAPPSDEQENAHSALSEVLAINTRTLDTLLELMELVTKKM
jgi:hypothetical protein